MRGFVAITTVLILVSVIVAAGATMTLLSVDEGRSGLALFDGETSLTFVEGCTEDAMLKARSDSTFGDPVGTPVNIIHPEGTCIVTVNSKTGSWDMDVTTNASGYKRTIKVIFIKDATGITLTSWREI